jgi:cysteine-rich repeat protein
MCTGTMPSVCTPLCGNGTQEAGETCDDGNMTGGDGCSASCAVEANYACAGTPSVCTLLASLTLDKAIAWPKRSDPAELSLRGSFMTGALGAADMLDFSEPFEFHVTDGLTMDEMAMLAVGECRSPSPQNGRVYCISADRKVRASFKPVRGMPGEYSFRIRMFGLGFMQPQAGPIELTIEQPGVSRTGANANCREFTTKLLCKN